MGGALRDRVAKAVARTRPQLFYYKAERDARAGLSVTARGDHLDIADPGTRRKLRIARANAVYLVDMLNSFDYYFRSAAPITLTERGERWEVVDFSTPRFQQVAGFADFPILCPSLTEPFVTAQQYLDFAQLEPGQVAIDLGSYSGLTSIAFSKAVGPGGRVVALEPDPASHAAARTNLAMHARLNRLDNVTLLQAAVGETTGQLSLSAEGAMGSADVSLVGGYRGAVVRVPMLSLGDLAEAQELARVDFVKMDIEGSEEAALRGAGDFLARFRPRIIVEPHVIDGTLTEAAVRARLEAYGYRCETIAQVGVSLPLVTGVPL